MIITVHALMANNAMPGSIGPYGFAFWTQRRTIKRLKQFKELYLFILQVAWIDHYQSNMQYKSDDIYDDATDRWNISLSGVNLNSFDYVYNGEENIV